MIHQPRWFAITDSLFPADNPQRDVVSIRIYADWFESIAPLAGSTESRDIRRDHFLTTWWRWCPESDVLDSLRAVV